jgi:pyruvate carboxylase
MSVLVKRKGVGAGILYRGAAPTKLSILRDSHLRMRNTRSSRLEAVRRLRRALEELIIEGVKTNREFMHLLTYHKDFIRGNYNTGFWEKNHTEIEKWLKEGITVK